MDVDRSEDLHSTLDSLYENWRAIRQETSDHLGGKEALHIIDVHGNNRIDIVAWISSRYERHQQTKILFFQFCRLFKEIYWLQFFFLTGNYATAYRNLRYILELMCQAYSVDTMYPELTLDEQVEKVMAEEETTYGWRLIRDVLGPVFRLHEREIEIEVQPLWRQMNRHVHPSATQMDLVATEAFSALLTDSFSEGLASEVVQTTDKVFDIVYPLMFERYPEAKNPAMAYRHISEWERYLPNTMRLLKEQR